jgi:hypothetical protein
MTLVPIRDQKLQRLLDYWQARRAGRAAPARSDIDPVDLGWILPDLTLVDVVGDPPRFFFRLVGNNMERRREFRWQGQWLDQLPSIELRETLAGTYGEVARTCTPRNGFREGVLDGRHIRHEYLVLPLSTDGATVDQLVVGTRFAR